MCPQKESRIQNKRKEISTANFSTAKMILFLGILTESLKRNAFLGILTEELKVLHESTPLYEPAGNGRKKRASDQMAIFDLRFSGERKPGLIQESRLTSPKRTVSFLPNHFLGGEQFSAKSVAN